MKGESELPFANAFWELRVYQKSRELQSSTLELTRSFPPEEKFALTDQIRRASRSIGAQIAEAWAKRSYIKHFQSKLTDAIGESNETQHWLISAVDARYLSSDQARPLFQLTNQIGAMLQTMIHRAEEFCIDPTSAKLREPSSEFYIITDEPSPFRSNPDEPPNTKH